MNHAVDWARTLGGLFVVLAMIVAAGWLLRRLQQRAGMGPGRRSQVVSVVAQQMLGAREKVVVVEVDGTWLVLGVTQHNVQTLHTLRSMIPIRCLSMSAMSASSSVTA